MVSVMDNEVKLEHVRHAQPAAGVKKSRRRAPARLRVLFRKLEPYLYLLPGLVLVGGLLHYSVIHTIGISFTNWNLISPPQFTGIDNYINVVRDPTFVRSFTNTLMWTGGSLLLPVAGGLILAVVLERIPGQRVIKVMVYLPATLAATVVAVIWSYVYSNNGVLNEGLRWIGLESLTQPWLVHAPTNTLAMIVTSTWRLLGPSLILFLVGLQTIPTELIEEIGRASCRERV